MKKLIKFLIIIALIFIGNKEKLKIKYNVQY